MSTLRFEGFTGGEIAAIIIGVLLIIGWMVAVVVWINSLLKKYTLNTDFDNPYREETLGLPNGTLRGVLTLTLLFVVIVLVCISMVVRQLQGTYDTLLSAFEIMLAFYFGSKVMGQIAKTDKEKTADKMRKEVDKSRAEAEALAMASGGTRQVDEFTVVGADG